MSLLRRLVALKLGALLGMAAAAAFVKRAVPSRGDAESDELALVAIFDGIELESRSMDFKGGSMLAWFGGIEVDLSGAELVDGARLGVHTLFGGIEITTPPGWRIDSNVKALLGGIDAPIEGPGEPGAPVLTLEGMAVVGGIEVRSGTPVAGATR